MNQKRTAVFLALLAAALYAVNVPFSKLLLTAGVNPTILAGFLYVGAGVGVGYMMLVKQALGLPKPANPLIKSDLPYTVAMVVLDIAAPIFLIYGIKLTNAANVSLLNNFEIVATSIIALVLFKEKISAKLWAAIVLVVIAGVILGFEGTEGFVLNTGSLFVLAACICWGFENNCTRSISDKSSEQIVVVKGLCSGAGGIAVALIIGEAFPSAAYVLLAMLLGFISYGLSINFYIMAQKDLGAAKTSAFYSVAPFLGVGFSFLFIGETPGLQFYLALAIMVLSTVIMVMDTLGTKSGSVSCPDSHPHRKDGGGSSAHNNDLTR